jgi:hypothetical protein
VNNELKKAWEEVGRLRLNQGGREARGKKKKKKKWEEVVVA